MAIVIKIIYFIIISYCFYKLMLLILSPTIVTDYNTYMLPSTHNVDSKCNTDATELKNNPRERINDIRGQDVTIEQKSDVPSRKLYIIVVGSAICLTFGLICCCSLCRLYIRRLRFIFYNLVNWILRNFGENQILSFHILLPLAILLVFIDMYLEFS